MSETVINMQKLLTAQEVAQWLNLPVPTVYEKARSSELPSVRLGRLVRFDPRVLERFVSQGGTQQ